MHATTETTTNVALSRKWRKTKERKETWRNLQKYNDKCVKINVYGTWFLSSSPLMSSSPLSWTISENVVPEADSMFLHFSWRELVLSFPYMLWFVRNEEAPIEQFSSCPHVRIRRVPSGAFGCSNKTHELWCLFRWDLWHLRQSYHLCRGQKPRTQPFSPSMFWIFWPRSHFCSQILFETNLREKYWTHQDKMCTSIALLATDFVTEQMRTTAESQLLE